MSIPVVAFDESGNSGANLLDAAQPVFVLASVQLDNDSATALVGPQSSELKFAKLKRSRSGRCRILDLLNSPQMNHEHVLLSGIHKPFMTITKLVDLLVEPLFWGNGIDLYQRGQNLAMANMFYYCMPAFIGKRRFRGLLAAFGNMVRFPSIEHIDVFYQILRDGYDHIPDDAFRDEIAMLLSTRRHAEAQHTNWNGTILNPAITAFVQHARIWTAQLGAVFSIIHDDSKALAQERLVLEAMMSHDAPARIGYDRRKMPFPIRATGVQFQDSRAFPQIQIADIAASSAAYCLRLEFHGQQNSFAVDILKTRVLQSLTHRVWPTALVTPEDLGTDEVGGIDANQYIGDYIANKLGGVPSTGISRNTRKRGDQTAIAQE